MTGAGSPEDGAVERLLALYDVPDGVEVVFEGGPEAGRRMWVPRRWADSGVIVLPAPSPSPRLADLSAVSPSFRTLRYRQVLDGLGWPSRMDDGALRFEFRDLL